MVEVEEGPPALEGVDSHPNHNLAVVEVVALVEEAVVGISALEAVDRQAPPALAVVLEEEVE